MGKNVAVFVDVANIFYAAKAAGVDIDYVTLLKSASAGRDLVRAYAYTGLDPDNENQRNFHDFLRRSNYKVVSKDIRKYGDGKVKANLDIELVVDMMKTARNLDIAIVVSGDGDFAPAIRAVQEQGVRVEVISFRGNTSSDLMEVADLFTDITQLAKVERGSRSGRRVAEDDADLSMTEVPDKQTEGTGAGRGRGGRGRGRGRAGEVEPVTASRGRGRGRTVSAPTNGVGHDVAGAPVALPGEKLSRSVGGGLTEADLAAAEVFTLDDTGEAGEATERPDGLPLELDGDEPRRRRRRGGRGRGRGRGRDEAPLEAGVSAAVDQPVEAALDFDQDEDEDDVDVEPVAAPRGPRTTPFGSVWDSQIGTPAPLTASLVPLADDEDFDEPEIPEYLIAEQRRGANRSGQSGARGGVRGGRAAYRSAIDRERYGRGGGGGGVNRYPDVSARTGAPANGGQSGPARDDRSYGRDRGPRDDRPRSTAPRASSEPWSEVPPELEAMLRAQVAQKPGAPVERAPQAMPHDGGAPAPAPTGDAEFADPEATAATETAPKRRTSSRKPATTKSTKATEASVVSGDEAAAEPAAAPAAKRRTSTRKPAGTTAAEPDGAAADATAAGSAAAAPKRRSTSKAASSTTAVAAVDGSADAATDAKPAPKRRAPRKSATAATETA